MVENCLRYHIGFGMNDHLLSIPVHSLNEWHNNVADNFKFKFLLSKANMSFVGDDYYEAEQWCCENFTEDFVLYRNTLYCKNEVDVMAFKLRWM